MNRHPTRLALVAAIKEEGVHKHAQRMLDTVRLQLQWHREDLLETIELNRENGVQAFDSETINRMRAAELARARASYGIPVRCAGVHKKA